MGFVIFETERTLDAICDGRTSLSPDASPRAFIAYRGTYRPTGQSSSRAPIARQSRS